MTLTTGTAEHFLCERLPTYKRETRNCNKVVLHIDQRLSWYGHVMRRCETHATKSVLSMNVEGWRGRGRPRKRWIDCLKEDMKQKGVDVSMTSDREEWKKKTCCADTK
ncbi:hypothetical protein B5X24_HaOG210780 [Helicoverpa armigera]|uniref:Uncharacterized protein n=1 Tax=Helicoverpa armigera TaxID=29058 RepID=A0A2W1BIS5_HELAM|nr:hypothetical protein B5X24_HaOG210780 [Helicoverpa armigera]